MTNTASSPGAALSLGRVAAPASRPGRALSRLRGYWAGLRPVPAAAADHDFFNVFERSKADLQRLLAVPLGDAAVLVMGCGHRYPDVLLYGSCAGRVAGLDVRRVFYRDGFWRNFRHQRSRGKGLLAATYNAVSERRGLNRYYRILQRHAGVPLRHIDLALHSYDGATSPLECDSFDATISNAVLQHVMDLPAFFAEAARLTKPGGITYHVLHNFCSLSGSLREERLCREQPWGHLRGLVRVNPAHLNGVRIAPMRELMGRFFDIVEVAALGKNHAKKDADPDFAFEHPELLTSDLRRELAMYPEEELLSRSYLLVGRKRA